MLPTGERAKIAVSLQLYDQSKILNTKSFLTNLHAVVLDCNFKMLAGFFEEPGKLENQEKNAGVGTRIRTNLNPHMKLGLEFKPTMLGQIEEAFVRGVQSNHLN